MLQYYSDTDGKIFTVVIKANTRISKRIYEELMIPDRLD